MKYILYISIFLLSIIPKITIGQWNYLNTGETRHLNCLEVFDEDTVYAFGFSGAFISSFDGGLSWTIDTVPNIGDIYFSDFINRYTGVVSDIDGNSSYTTDGGISWQPIGPIPGSPSATDINLTADSIIIMTGFIGWSPITSNLFISNDWGNTWNLNWISPGISTGLEVLNDSTWILGMVDFSLFKTIDKGISWQNVFVSNPGSHLQYLDSSDDSTIYGIGCIPNCDYCFLHSEDQGNTWSGSLRTGKSLFFFNNGTGSIIPGCDPVGGQALLYSADSGHTTYLSHLVSGDTLLVNIKYANNYVGYVCGWYGTVLKTTNGGTTATDEIPSLEIDIYPNPFSDHFKISYNSNKLIAFSIYDELSRKLLNINISSETLLLNTTTWSSGIYFYSLTDYQGNKSNGKLIKIE